LAFLTKKEQSLIRLVNANAAISTDQKKATIEEINYNARLRQDRYRKPVKEFLYAFSGHQTNSPYRRIKRTPFSE